jgi:hypothetical protein
VTAFVRPGEPACAFRDIEHDAIRGAVDLITQCRNVTNRIKDSEGLPESKCDAIDIQALARQERFGVQGFGVGLLGLRHVESPLEELDFFAPRRGKGQKNKAPEKDNAQNPSITVTVTLTVRNWGGTFYTVKAQFPRACSLCRRSNQ